MRAQLQKTVFTWMILSIALAATAIAAVPDNDTVNISITINTPPSVTAVTLDDYVGGSADDSIDLIASGNQTVLCTFNVSEVDGADTINHSTLNVTITSNVTGYTGTEDVKTEFHLSWSNITTTDACLNQTTGSNSPALGGWVYYNCSIAMPYFAEVGSWTCFTEVFDNTSISGSGLDSANVTSLIALNISRDLITFNPIGLGQNTTSQDYNTTIENVGNVPIDVRMTSHWNESQPLNDTYAMTCTSGQINESDILFDDDNIFTPDIGDAGNWTYLNNTFLNFVTGNINLNEANNFSTRAYHTIYWGINLQKSIALNPQGQCTGFLLLDAITA